MGQRTNSDRQFHAGERKLNADSARLMAEAKIASALEAKDAAAEGVVVAEITVDEAFALLESIQTAGLITDLMERPEVVGSGTQLGVLALAEDCKYSTGRYGMGMNGR